MRIGSQGNALANRNRDCRLQFIRAGFSRLAVDYKQFG
jgi:hypothetical protein